MKVVLFIVVFYFITLLYDNLEGRRSKYVIVMRLNFVVVVDKCY